ncbi:MAG TPA: cellulase family glycosylhydrolase [Mycobacteriales bacterium]|nr:cellulase family glycosylhydrolase [Mycobacteriales bacterium]HWA68024.1 cellulase family glycosylhydrolase [Mycobacteriales bacterium]
MRRATWPARLALGAVLALLLPTAVPSLATAARRSPGARTDISRVDSWLVDRQGRVVELHGFDIIRKTAPFYPSHFTAKDADFLVRNGFTGVRIGLIWSAVEPRPGVYDDRYLRTFIRFADLLAAHRIHALVDFHQDAWSASAGGDGAPRWATLGNNLLSDFQAFWDNRPGPGGVGIQTRFVAAWRHVVRLIDASPAAPSLIGLDPFNEPYAGTKSLCAPFVPCPAFESGPLAAFYRRVIKAIRSTGDRHVIFPEGVAQNGLAQPSLPRFGDPQTAFSFHYYCPLTQDATAVQPTDAACQPLERHGIGSFESFAARHDVPAILGEFSCNDATDDNAAMVDAADERYTSWMAWMYYAAKDDPANCPGQGLLRDDARPGSLANVKTAKLGAFEVPYPQAIAGTPGGYRYDRTSRTMTLSYAATAVPGATLAKGTATVVFVPRFVYRNGYRADVSGAHVTSRPGAQRLTLVSDRHGATVTVTVRPR